MVRPAQPGWRQSSVKVRYSARMISILPLLCCRQARARLQPCDGSEPQGLAAVGVPCSMAPITACAAACHSTGICAFAGVAPSSAKAAAIAIKRPIMSVPSIIPRRLPVGGFELDQFACPLLGGIASSEPPCLILGDQPIVARIVQTRADLPAVILVGNPQRR